MVGSVQISGYSFVQGATLAGHSSWLWIWNQRLWSEIAWVACLARYYHGPLMSNSLPHSPCVHSVVVPGRSSQAAGSGCRNLLICVVYLVARHAQFAARRRGRISHGRARWRAAFRWRAVLSCVSKSLAEELLFRTWTRRGGGLGCGGSGILVCLLFLWLLPIVREHLQAG